MPGFNLRAAQQAMGDDRISGFQKKFGKGGDFRFKAVYWSSLADGQYRLRLAPRHPQKCPQGFVRVSTHRVEVKVGEKPQEIVCTYRPGVADSECFLCDILEAVQDELDSFSKEVKEVLNQMAPRSIFIFPGIMTIKPDPDFVPDAVKKYPPWVPDDNARQGVMLQIEGKRVLTALFDLLKEYDDCNDPDEGYWLSITKQGRETPIIRAARKPSELTPAEAELFGDKDYPHLHPIPKFMSKSTRELTVPQQKSLIDGAWWKDEVLADEDDGGLDAEDLPFD